MKIGLLFLTFILGHPFAFANGEPPEYGPIEYESNVCNKPAPIQPFRQYGETWCSYSRRFSVYSEYYSKYRRAIKGKCGRQVPAVRAVKNVPRVNDNTNCD